MYTRLERSNCCTLALAAAASSSDGTYVPVGPAAALQRAILVGCDGTAELGDTFADDRPAASGTYDVAPEAGAVAVHLAGRPG